MAAARFADGWVRLLSKRPPEILFCGASVSQEVKCFAVGPAAHVGADLGEQPQRIVGADAIDLREVHPGELVERRAQIEARFVVLWLLSPARCGQRTGGHGRSRCEPGQVAFDRRIARGELSLIGVEEFQVLLEAEDVFGSVIAA